MAVHAGQACPFLVFVEDVRREGDDGGAWAVVAQLPGAQLLGGGKTVEHRHLAIH
ncbi:hypothetical protein D3C86_1970140 [compost metagenome]